MSTTLPVLPDLSLNPFPEQCRRCNRKDKNPSHLFPRSENKQIITPKMKG